jgi:HlyD family secretion protein
MKHLALSTLGLALLIGACKKEVPLPLYEKVAVGTRDITVAAEAAGSIEPILVVDVKSRASGTILSMRAETGDLVRTGDTLVLVDRRDPTNTLNQAQADLEVARAQLSNAESQKRRMDQMFTQQLVSEQEHEAANLTYANARAQLVRAETQVQTARDALDDTSVRAPISGVIIAKNVEVGNVIASATRDVSGGVVLLKMADLNEVQVRTLVDETDIGKIQPGVAARITVDAYPNRPFQGTVLKIEPQSTTSQNVTMFPVLIRIANMQGLLRPGMNAQVEIQVAAKQGVLAIPNAALRTQRDVASAASVLGLNPADVQRTLAQADSLAGGRNTGQNAVSGRTGGQSAAAAPRTVPQQVAAVPETAGSMAGRTPPDGQTGSRPDGQQGQQGGGTFQLPPGVTREMLTEIRRKREAGETLTPAESTASARMRSMREQQGGAQPSGQPGAQTGAMGQMGAMGAPQGAAPQGGDEGGGAAPGGISMDQMRPIFQKMQSGAQLTPQEQAMMTRYRASMGSGGGGSSQRQRFGSGNNFQFGGSYIVFVMRDGQPAPVRIRTGVTDMDYSEVVSGLTDRDTVLLLPSASLVQSQADMKDRFSRMSGGGVPGMKQQAPAAASPQATTGTSPAGAGGAQRPRN